MHCLREVVEPLVAHERPGTTSQIVGTAKVEGRLAGRQVPMPLAPGSRVGIQLEMAHGIVDWRLVQHGQRFAPSRLDRRPASKDAGKHCPRPCPPAQHGGQRFRSYESSFCEALWIWKARAIVTHHETRCAEGKLEATGGQRVHLHKHQTAICPSLPRRQTQILTSLTACAAVTRSGTSKACSGAGGFTTTLVAASATGGLAASPPRGGP